VNFSEKTLLRWTNFVVKHFTVTYWKKTILIEQHNYNIILSSFLEKTASTVRPAQRLGYERESIPRNERNMGDAHAKDDRELWLCRASTSNTPSLASGFYLARLKL